MQHNRIPVRRQRERNQVLARMAQERAYESYAANVEVAAVAADHHDIVDTFIEVTA